VIKLNGVLLSKIQSNRNSFTLKGKKEIAYDVKFINLKNLKLIV